MNTPPHSGTIAERKYSDLLIEKKKQRERLVPVLILALLGAYVVVFIFGLFYRERPMMTLSAIGGLLLLVPFVFLRLRLIALSGWSLVINMLVMLTLLATFGQGYRDIAVFGFPVILVFTSIAMSRKDLLIILCLMLAALSWLIIGQLYGVIIPVPVHSISWADLVLFSIIFLFLAFAVDRVTDSMRRNYRQAQDELAQRRRSEEAHSLAEKKYNKVFHLNPSACGLSDVTSRAFVEVNDAFCKLFGYEKHEVIGKTAFDLGILTPEASKAMLQKADSNGSILNAETDLRTKSGDIRHALLSAENIELQERIYRFTVVHDVTERTRAARLLQESESRFRIFVEQAPIAIGLFDMEGRGLYANQKFMDILGLRTSDEVIGRPAYEFFAPQFREESKERTRLRKLGLPVPAEYESIAMRADGAPFPVHMAVALINLSEGPASIAFLNDITDRLKSEETLRISEDKFFKIFQASPSAIIISELATFKIVDCNGAFEQIFGYSRSEVLGKDSAELAIWQKEERERLMPEFRAAGMVDVREMKMFRRSGEAISVKARFTRIQIGGVDHSIAVVTDITDRKRAEQDVKESRDRLALAASSAELGIWDWDIVNDKMIWNDQMFTLYGIAERPDSYGVGIWKQGLHPDDVSYAWDECAAAIRGERPYDIEFRVVHPNGNIRYIKADGIVLRDENGNALRMIGVNHDITDRKLAEEERLHYEQALQQNQKLESLGILAGGIAHDFNNLMGGVFGHIDMAREASADERVTRYLAQAMNAIDRARGLTAQLLTFAKGGDPIRKVGYLFPFIEDTARFALSGAAIACRVHVPPGLAACSFDRNQIGQVIDNLVINAQQAMPAGGTIDISAENISFGENEHPLLPRGDYVTVAVKDSGIGIPEELLPRIFDPFFTTKTKGHGLGLATCHSILHRHGGCITAESDPGRGSTFRLYLPAERSTVLPADEERTVRHAGSGTFLVMDDEDVMRDAVSSMLISFGYSVIAAKSGDEALDIFRSEKSAGRSFAGMIFDLTVPGGMGGKEAVAAIRAVDRDVPVFVASGYADDSAMKDPAAYGFSGSIGKPFRKADLEAMLERSIRAVSGSILLIEDDEAIASNCVEFLTHYGYEAHAAASGVEGLVYFREHRDAIALIIADAGESRGGLLRELRALKPAVRIILISGNDRSHPDVMNVLEGISDYEFLSKPFPMLARADRPEERCFLSVLEGMLPRSKK